MKPRRAFATGTPTSNFPPCGPRLPLTTKRKQTTTLLPKPQRPLNVIHSSVASRSSTENGTIAPDASLSFSLLPAYAPLRSVCLRPSCFNVDPHRGGSVDAITAPPCGGILHLPHGASLGSGW